MKFLRILLVIVVALAILSAPLAAAASAKGEGEGAGPSQARKVWDTVWKFVNFLILAGVIYKFGRKPLMSFLAQQSGDIAETLKKNEALLAEARADYQTAEEKLAHIEKLIGEIE